MLTGHAVRLSLALQITAALLAGELNVCAVVGFHPYGVRIVTGNVCRPLGCSLYISNVGKGNSLATQVAVLSFTT